MWNLTKRLRLETRDTGQASAKCRDYGLFEAAAYY
jgi:hypothetical protein